MISIGAIVLLTPMVAYAITKNPNKRFFSFLLYFITGGMFVPFQIVALPLAICMSRMHLSNKFGIIIVYVTYAMIMGVFLCHGYLKTVPAELEESAYLDGAGRWRAFFSIIFPLITPIIATIIILNFLWIWNEFLIALVLMTNSKDQTLMLFIYSFKGEYTFEYNLMFAAVVMSIIPITILYAFLQKYIVTGLTGGAVKT